MPAPNVPPFKPFGDRFRSYIQWTPSCWLWTGQKRNGYGEFRLIPTRQGIRELAHRISYAIHSGPIPKGMFVCHKCDNPPCVNPDHLFLGTSKDDNQDRHRKGGYVNQPQGENHFNVFLTEAQVRAIHDRYVPNKNSPELAAEFGIDKRYVWLIGTERRWKHLW